jgi:predicted metalloprotease
MEWRATTNARAAFAMSMFEGWERARSIVAAIAPSSSPEVCSPDGGEQGSQLRAAVATSAATPANAAAVRSSPACGGMMTRFGTSLVNSIRMKFSVATGSARPSSMGHSAESVCLKDFVSLVLANTEDTWHDLFSSVRADLQGAEVGPLFRRCRLGVGLRAVGHGTVLWSSRPEGVARSFVLPGTLRPILHARGLCGCCVIAHEVGHHVQNLLGIMDEADVARG